MSERHRRPFAFIAETELLPGAPGELGRVRQFHCDRGVECRACFAKGLWSFLWSLGWPLAGPTGRPPR